MSAENSQFLFTNRRTTFSNSPKNKNKKGKKFTQTRPPTKDEVYKVITKFFMEQYFNSLEDRNQAVSSLICHLNYPQIPLPLFQQLSKLLSPLQPLSPHL